MPADIVGRSAVPQFAIVRWIAQVVGLSKMGAQRGRLNTMNVSVEISGFLLNRRVGVLATSSNRHGPRACTVFYATRDGRRLYMKFQTSSEHAQNLRANSHCAFAVYDHQSTYRNKSGIQLLGTCVRVTDRAEMQAAVDLYSEILPGARERFAPLDELLAKNSKSTLYVMEVTKGKIVHDDFHLDTYETLEPH